MQHHLVFVEMKYFFVLHLTWNTISCNINTFLAKPNHLLCNVKLSISTQNCFSYFTKFLFWTSFRMLCHVEIYYCHILCDTKKLISCFVYHHFFIFSFYITHFQHVDLLRNGPGNKQTFNPSFTHISDIYRSSC